MNEFMTFLKDIFMITPTKQSVGLSQFRAETIIEQPSTEKSIKNKDIKLSDLMRRS